MDKQTQFYRAIINDDLNVFKTLLNDKKVDPADKDNSALETASYYGRLNIIKLLIKDNRVNPATNNNSALYTALRWEYFEVVKLFLKDERVKDLLINNDINLYHQLKKYDIENIVEHF